MMPNWKLVAAIGSIVVCALAILLSVFLMGADGHQMQEAGKCGPLLEGPPLPEDSEAIKLQATQRDAAGAYDIRAAPGWDSTSQECRSLPNESTLRELGECGELGQDVVCQMGECGYIISSEGKVTLVYDGPRLNLLNPEIDGRRLSTPANGGWNTPYQLTCPGTTNGRSLSMSVLDITDTQGSLGVEMPFATIMGRSPDNLVARYNDYVQGGQTEIGSFRNYNMAGQEQAAMEITFARPYEGVQRFVMAVKPINNCHTTSATLDQNGCTYQWSSWFVAGSVSAGVSLAFDAGLGVETGVYFNSCPTTPVSNVLQLSTTTYLDIHVGEVSSAESAYWSVMTLISDRTDC